MTERRDAMKMSVFSSPAYTAVLPPGHAFPMEKFAQSATLVRERSLAEVIDPGSVATVDLLRVHTDAYVRSIDGGGYNDLTKLRLGLPWHLTIRDRSRAATAGTLAAARAALRDGIAANLAGGTHHAFADRGEGYCVFNDVAVAVRALRQDEPLLHTFVLDLDAHQGNGTNALFANDRLVFTYSIHGERNYPSTKVPGSLDVGLSRFASADEYFTKLRATLPQALDAFEPDLVFYNAGVDVHEHDRFGQMKLTTADVRKRDETAIALARGTGAPLVVVYGGGYHAVPGMTAELHVQTITVAAEQFRRERAPSIPPEDATGR